MGGRRVADARPEGERAAFLKDGFHMVALGTDIVVLDRRSDIYSCLPDAAEALQVCGARVIGPEAWLGALAEAGLTVGERDEDHRPTPPLPVRAFPDTASRSLHLPEIAALGRAMLEGWSHGPAAPVDTLIRTLPPATGGAADPARIAAVVAGFRTVLPWAPRQGACLFRASVLLRALRHAGQDAVWVFGVRTWPFAAHCWLQIHDAVLDDDPERVGLFTPIMAV